MGDWFIGHSMYDARPGTHDEWMHLVDDHGDIVKVAAMPLREANRRNEVLKGSGYRWEGGRR
jgi:hypothetical protein